MPGFNIGTFGGGYNGDAGNSPSNTVEVRRKHRWVFETIGRGTGVWSAKELLVLQSASRPSFKFEEPEMHHNQEVARFAGKQDWDPVTLVWYDVEQEPDISRGVYHWLETVVNMQTINVASPADYKRIAALSMIDGSGQTTETWTMNGTWPSAINWQELDYTSTDLMTCEATMRYDRAVRASIKGDCVPAVEVAKIQPNCPV